MKIKIGYRLYSPLALSSPFRLLRPPTGSVAVTSCASSIMQTTVVSLALGAQVLA